jgi:hypothetical protein
MNLKDLALVPETRVMGFLHIIVKFRVFIAIQSKISNGGNDPQSDLSALRESYQESRVPELEKSHDN